MTIIRPLLVLLLLFASGSLAALETTRLLDQAVVDELQKSLEDMVAAQGLTTAVSSRELALMLVIVTDPEHPKLAELNGRNMVYAASLPKIAILLGAAVSIEEGSLDLDEDLKSDLTSMIRSSCNPCATRVLEKVGRQRLLEILQAPEYNYYDKSGSGGLWVGKDYGPGAAYQRDPLSGLSHGATAFQAARFYYELHTGVLVSPEQSMMMLEALSDSAIQHKFVKGLSNVPGIEIYRKSGTWKNYHADSALVRANGLTYIIVALANHSKGGLWLEQLAAPMHQLAVSHNLQPQQPASSK